MTQQQSYLKFQQAWNALKAHPFRISEIPVEHSISLPVPTLRFGGPGYAQFAGPCLRKPMMMPVYSPPDRWWILDARLNLIRLYATTEAMPFGESAFQRQEVKTVGTLDELYELQGALASAIDNVREAFFNNANASAAQRQALVELFSRLVPKQLMPLYVSLCPDFFSYLGA